MAIADNAANIHAIARGHDILAAKVAKGLSSPQDSIASITAFEKRIDDFLGDDSPHDAAEDHSDRPNVNNSYHSPQKPSEEAQNSQFSQAPDIRYPPRRDPV
jgi:hypothetical protein